MSNEPFDAPAPANGIKWADVNGALILVEVHALETGIQTAYGETDAIRADVAVLDGDGKGDTYPDCLVFPKALQSQLRSRIGRKVLGRVMQGASKPGQSPPWLLAEATEGEKAIGVAYLSNGFAQPASAAGDTPPF